jgi:hypothetical protein
MPPPQVPDDTPTGADARRSSRQQPARVAAVTVFAQPDYRGRAAVLRDLSVGGAGVFLDDAVEVGTLLFVQLPGRRDGRTRTLAARVVYVERLNTGQCLAGCRWRGALTEEEVQQALHAFG